MATMQFYHNGESMGKPGHNPDPPKRGVTGGWSKAVVARHRHALMSIDTSRLTGAGFSLSLTVRDCPATAAAFQKLRRSFIKSLERRGIIWGHWVVEWQRRGVPHLHMCAYFPDDSAVTCTGLKRLWVETAGHYRPRLIAQAVDKIKGITGWLQYLAKHSARGVWHYQRQADNIPRGWVKTGRMWGFFGDVPKGKPVVFRDVPDEIYYRFRRFAKRYALAQLRARRPDMYFATAPGLSSQRVVMEEDGFYSSTPYHRLQTPPPACSGYVAGRDYHFAPDDKGKKWLLEFRAARDMLKYPSSRKRPPPEWDLKQTRRMSAARGLDTWGNISVMLPAFLRLCDEWEKENPHLPPVMWETSAGDE